MRISEKGIALIIEFEGCGLTAYKCSSGIWTIGYGHTGTDVYEGLKITKENAKELLYSDLRKRCEDVNRLLKVQVNQAQFDALISLEYNIGYGNFKNSSILRCINTGDFNNAAWYFYHENPGAKTLEEKYRGCWVFGSNKKVLPGLVRRRKAEKELFIS